MCDKCKGWNLWSDMLFGIANTEHRPGGKLYDLVLIDRAGDGDASTSKPKLVGTYDNKGAALWEADRLNDQRKAETASLCVPSWDVYHVTDHEGNSYSGELLWCPTPVRDTHQADFDHAFEGRTNAAARRSIDNNRPKGRIPYGPKVGI